MGKSADDSAAACRKLLMQMILQRKHGTVEHIGIKSEIERGSACTVCVCVCIKRRLYYRNSLARAVRRDASSLSRRTRSACAWSFGLAVLASRAASDSLHSPILSAA